MSHASLPLKRTCRKSVLRFHSLLPGLWPAKKRRKSSLFVKSNFNCEYSHLSWNSSHMNENECSIGFPFLMAFVFCTHSEKFILFFYSYTALWVFGWCWLVWLFGQTRIRLRLAATPIRPSFASLSGVSRTWYKRSSTIMHSLSRKMLLKLMSMLSEKMCKHFVNVFLPSLYLEASILKAPLLGWQTPMPCAPLTLELSMRYFT